MKHVFVHTAARGVRGIVYDEVDEDESLQETFDRTVDYLDEGWPLIEYCTATASDSTVDALIQLYEAKGVVYHRGLGSLLVAAKQQTLDQYLQAQQERRELERRHNRGLTLLAILILSGLACALYF
jgi:hypothetical protein